jgi:hypothetical protein
LRLVGLRREDEPGESLAAASSKTGRFENRIEVRKPAEPSGVMMSGKNAHLNLLHVGPALVSSNRLDRNSSQQRCLRDR